MPFRRYMFRLYKDLFKIYFNKFSSILFVGYPKSNPDKISVYLQYPHKLNSTKKFSLLRPKSELLSSFLYRLKCKINIDLEKAYNKKMSDFDKSLSDYLIKETFVKNKNFKLPNDLENMALTDILIDESILFIDEHEYKIIVNFPIVSKLKLPAILLSNYPIFPKISMDYGNISDLNYEWFISLDKRKWEFVGSGFTFLPKSNYLNHFIKLEINCPKTNNNLQAISKTVIIECPKQLAIEARWQHTKQYIDNPMKFRVVSYNILAKIYSETSLAKENFFRHCPHEYLSMDYRKLLLVKEIFNYHSDIICLQEVDYSFFKNVLSTYFSMNGYDCLFQEKNFESMEGQAILWRKEKYNLIENISIPSLSNLVLDKEMIHLSQISDFVHSSSILLSQWIGLKQCMVGCVLQPLCNEAKQLIITNTHLYFRPDAEVIRLLQIGTILHHLKIITNKYPDAQIIMAGDFNDNRNSTTIDLVTRRSACLNYVSTEETLTVSLSHDLSLKSACDSSFTNYILDFSSELDFIFYDIRGLFCDKTVPLPSLEDITSGLALPNIDFPSDHLALIADFQYLNNERKLFLFKLHNCKSEQRKS